ncbi:hypothetical protein BGX33_006775 [Mortierella sp. NVP41]|nr:hypothetical protein BGX33_006775 [Mortierella sp. NVP41]
MASENKPAIDTPCTGTSSGSNTANVFNEASKGENQTPRHQECPNKDGTATSAGMKTLALQSSSISHLDPVLPETLAENATKLCSTPPRREQTKDGQVMSTDISPTPVTPRPMVAPAGLTLPSHATTNNHHAVITHTGQDRTTSGIGAAGSSTGVSLTEIPIFDPEPLEKMIAEHRADTVKKFNEVVRRLDAFSAELQYILSEYLTRQYDRIEQTLARGYVEISEAEKRQEREQEKILAFLNTMKNAFAIFGGNNDA